MIHRLAWHIQRVHGHPTPHRKQLHSGADPHSCMVSAKDTAGGLHRNEGAPPRVVAAGG